VCGSNNSKHYEAGLSLTAILALPILRHLHVGFQRVNQFQADKNRVIWKESNEGIMPNHKSAEKRVRQSERRRKLNRGNRSRLRTSLKNLRSALEGDGKQASAILPETISTIDRAVQKGVLHKNAAARYKSRLTARVNAAAAK
jgi:small subunit ribosomal protein S20